MKEYIVELDKPFNSTVKDYFTNRDIKVIFHDEILSDLVIIETNCDINSLEHVKSFNEPRVGELLHKADVKSIRTVKMEPHIDPAILYDYGYGFGVKIAVLDSGVNKDICPDIEDEIDFTGVGKYTEFPHGSVVTSIIKHYAKASHIYSAKVCQGGNDLKEANIFKGLKWARQKQVDIINMSIGLPYNCDGNCQLSRYINTIVEKFGIMIVSAAGNDSESDGLNFEKKVHCPACAFESISVGSLSKTGDDVAHFSVPGLVNSDKPNIVTSGFGYLYSNGDYTPFQGTSFSAPVITGIMGCLVSYLSKTGINVVTDSDKIIRMQKLRLKLFETATFIDGVYASRQGLGKFNLINLLEVLDNESKSNTAGKAN